MQKFKKSLTTLYWYFQASAVQTAGLKAVQELLDSPVLKMKEAKDVRWLSHDNAIQTLRRTLPAVLIALEREASEKEEPVAIGLVKVMKHYEFVSCLYLMCEVLPHLSHLSRLFQAEYIQLSMVWPSLNACIKSLTAYNDFTKAADVVATDSAIADELEQFDLAVSPECKEAFNKNVRQPFLDLLLQNLHVEDRFPQVELLRAFSIFDPSEGVSSCTSASDIAAAYLDKVRILANHYGTGENPLVNTDELYEEWGTFSVMLADHYSKAKTKDVLRDLVLTDKLQPLFPSYPSWLQSFLPYLSVLLTVSALFLQ